MKEEGKLAAVLGYITPLGWIIAYIMHRRKRAPLAAWHLRQSLFLHLAGMTLYGLQVFFLYIPFIGWLIGFLLLLAGIAWLLFWAIGIIFAFNAEMRPVPLLGIFAQRLFKSLE